MQLFKKAFGSDATTLLISNEEMKVNKGKGGKQPMSSNIPDRGLMIVGGGTIRAGEGTIKAAQDVDEKKKLFCRRNRAKRTDE